LAGGKRNLIWTKISPGWLKQNILFKIINAAKKYVSKLSTVLFLLLASSMNFSYFTVNVMEKFSKILSTIGRN
jgi:hypothetical protein